MKFYHIWAKFFSFEFKNTKKTLKQSLEIRNMSPKNAIKVINIQKSYSIQIGSIQSICPLLSNVVLFSSFSPLKFYSVQFDPLSCIQSTLDLFGPYQSYSVHLVHFDLLQSYLSHSVHIGPIWSILFTFVLFSPFYPLQSHSVHIAPN